MAAMDFFSQFETLWAQTGQVEAIEDNQYKAGWAYIGATPPSVEQFNKVQQLSDQKAAWLFAQIKELAEQGGYALTPGMVDALTMGIAASMQSGAGVVGEDTGAANAYVVDYSPAIGALTDGMALWFKVKTANTGASTLNVNGLGARPIIGMGHSTLQGGELVANGKALAVWKEDSNSWVLVACSGAAQQVAPATRGSHVVQFGQIPGIVGAMRNARMTVTAVSASATFTADEVVVQSALGGLTYCLANVNKTINLGVSGPGGMVAAPAPASTWIAIYLIFNPTTAASALLGVPAPSAPAPEVCAPANLPSGYTASALVSVVTTDPGGLFKVLTQRDRKVVFPGIGVFNTQTDNASFQPISLSGAVPPNAKTAGGYGDAAITAPGTINFAFASDAVGMGSQTFNSSCASAYGHSLIWTEIPLASQQTVYIYRNAVLNGSGVRQYTAYCSSYTF